MFKWPDVWQHNQFSHHQMIPDDYSLTSSQEWVRSWSQSSAQLSPTVSLSPPWPRWHVSDELSPALKDFTGTWLDEPHLSRGQIRLPRLFFNYSAGNRERFWVWTSQQWARWTNSEADQISFRRNLWKITRQFSFYTLSVKCSSEVLRWPHFASDRVMNVMQRNGST